jgi:hypothetical protein
VVPPKSKQKKTRRQEKPSISQPFLSRAIWKNKKKSTNKNPKQQKKHPNEQAITATIQVRRAHLLNDTASEKKNQPPTKIIILPISQNTTKTSQLH